MNTTILDNVLREQNLYSKNGLVFSRAKPIQYLGNLNDILPKILEKNKTKKEIES